MAEADRDRRVRKTKAQLRQSLVRLLEEKPLKDITVKELTEAADVNRGTFYTHYKDIYDLREQIEDEAFRELLALLDSYGPDMLRRGLRPILTDVFRFVLRNGGLGAVLLDAGAMGVFLDRVKTELSRRVQQEWRGVYGFGPGELDYYIDYVVSGWVAMLQRWTRKGMREPPEEMAAMAERFILFGLQS